jgi:hypothetical protein
MESLTLAAQLAVLFGQIVTDCQQLLLLPRQLFACPAVLLRQFDADLLERALLHLGGHERAKLGAKFCVGQSHLERFAVHPGDLLVYTVECDPRPIHVFSPPLQRAAFLLEVGPVAARLLVETLSGGVQFGLRLAAFLDPSLAELLEIRFPLANPETSVAKAGLNLRSSGIELRFATIQLVLPHGQVVGQLDRLSAKLLDGGGRFPRRGEAGRRPPNSGGMALSRGPCGHLPRIHRSNVGGINPHVELAVRARHGRRIGG